MLSYEILTPGHKIKKIRKEIGATQIDIAGKFKRELISLIENDKINLSKSTAIVLVDNINKIIIDKNISQDFITLDELLEEPYSQIEKIIETYKSELKHIKMSENPENILKQELEEIEEFFQKYNVSLEKKCEVYEILADIFYDRSNWEESKIYYSICRDLALIKENNESILKYIACLTRIYYRMDTPKEILIVSRFAIQIINKNYLEKNKDAKAIYYNSALAYCRLNKLDEAIHILNEILDMPELTREQILDLNTQMGSCYLKKKEYDIAEKCFNKVLCIANDDTNCNAAALAYLNLATVKIETKDYCSAEKLTDLASEIKADDNYNIASNLYNMVLIYIKLNKLNKVEKYYIEAIEYSIKIYDEYIQKDLLNKLSEYFIINKHYKYLENLLLTVKLKVLKKELKIKEVIEIYMLGIEAFREIDKRKFMKFYGYCIELINFLRNSN